MKKILMYLIVVLSICWSFGYAASRNINVLLNRGVKIMYDSKIQEFQNVNGVRVYPITYEGTTYLPVRSISSIFGERIKWVGETRSVYIGEGDLDTTSSKEIKNFIAGINEEIEVLYDEDINVYYANEVQVFRDVNQKRVYPLSYNGTTYLPVRAVANLFKVSIDWDGKNNAVLIGKRNISGEKSSEEQKSDEISITAVKIDEKDISLEVGQTKQIDITILPSDATNKKLTWSTNQSKVAKVSSSGKITAVGPGVAIITAKTSDGKHSATCNVTVNPKIIAVTEITISKTSLTLEKGKSETISVKVSPNDASNKEVTWATSNAEVATVNNGQVTAVSSGTATITVKTIDGGHLATCIVTVPQPVTPAPAPTPEPAPEPTPPTPTPPAPTADKIHFIDVTTSTNHDNGEAILLESNGKYALVDTGFNDDTGVYNYLITNGIRHLEFIILSHSHADHIGGCQVFRQAQNNDPNNSVSVGQIFIKNYDSILNVEDVDKYAYNKMKEWAAERGIPITYIDKLGENNRFTMLGDMTIEFLNRSNKIANGKTKDDNKNSTVVCVRVNGHSALLTGDYTTQDALQTLINSVYKYKTSTTSGPIDVYKIGHHGYQGMSLNIKANYVVCTNSKAILKKDKSKYGYSAFLKYKVKGKAINVNKVYFSNDATVVFDFSGAAVVPSRNP